MSKKVKKKVRKRMDEFYREEALRRELDIIRERLYQVEHRLRKLDPTGDPEKVNTPSIHNF